MMRHKLNLPNKETGVCRLLAQVHKKVTRVGENVNLHMVNPELCISVWVTLPLTYGMFFGIHQGSCPKQNPCHHNCHGRQSHAPGEVIS